MDWGLLREKLEPVDVRAIAEALAPLVGWATTHLLLAMQIRQGVWFRGVDEETARRLEEGLRRLGIGARAVRLAELIQPPHPRPVRNADPRPHGLEIQDGFQFIRIVWERIGLLAATRVEEQRLAYRSVPGVTPLLGNDLGTVWDLLNWDLHTDPEPKAVWRPDHCWVLDLVTVDAEARYRIRSHEFCYDYLGQRRQPTSAANFVLLLQDLARHTPRARRTGTVESLLANPNAALPPLDLLFFEEEVRWHCQWLARGGGPPVEIVI